MAKKLPTQVDGCVECPFLRDSEDKPIDYVCGHGGTNGWNITCNEVHGGVVRSGPGEGNKIPTSIPDWCELEDVPE